MCRQQVATWEYWQRSAETSTGRAILSIDAMLQGVGQALGTTYGSAPIGGTEVQSMLRRINEQSSSVHDVMIIDENGRRVNGGSSTVGPARSYADQTYINAYQDGTVSG